MWTKSENSESARPAELEQTRSGVIIRRNFRDVEATAERPAHCEWEEWQMTADQYEVYKAMMAEHADIEDALIELAEIIVGE